MPHPHAPTPRFRTRRAEGQRRLWAGMPEDVRAVRLEKLREARLKAALVRDQKKRDVRAAQREAADIVDRDPAVVAKAISKAAVMEEARHAEETPRPVQEGPVPPWAPVATHLSTPNATTMTEAGREIQDVRPAGRIPTALALHLLSALRTLWAQEPGRPAAPLPVPAGPAGAFRSPIPQPRTDPPEGRADWADRLSLLSRRLSAAADELLDDRRHAPGADGAYRDSLTAFHAAATNLATVLRGRDPADSTRDEVDAFLTAAIATFRAFDVADLARRRGVRERPPVRSVLPAASNGYLRVARHHQGLRERADHLFRVAEGGLVPNRADFLRTAAGRTTLANLDRSLESLGRRLRETRAEYLGRERRKDLAEVFDGLSALTGAARERLARLRRLADAGADDPAIRAPRGGSTGDPFGIGTVHDPFGIGVVRDRLADDLSGIGGVRDRLSDDLSVLARALADFDRDEREHERTYRAVLRSERIATPKDAAVAVPDSPPPKDAAVAVPDSPPPKGDPDATGRLLDRIAAEGDRRARAESRRIDRLFVDEPDVEQKLDDLLVRLRERGAGVREDVASLRRDVESGLAAVRACQASLLDEVVALRKAVDGVLVPELRSFRFVAVSRLDAVGSRARYEEPVGERRRRAEVSDADTRDAIRSALLEAVGSLEGRLAIVIRENFLRLVHALPVQDRDLKREVAGYARRVREGTLGRIGALIKALEDKEG